MFVAADICLSGEGVVVVPRFELVSQGGGDISLQQSARVMCFNSSCANGDICHYFITAAATEQDGVDDERVPSPENEDGKNDESEQENADHQNGFGGKTTDGKSRYPPHRRYSFTECTICSRMS